MVTITFTLLRNPHVTTPRLLCRKSKGLQEKVDGVKDIDPHSMRCHVLVETRTEVDSVTIQRKGY